MSRRVESGETFKYRMPLSINTATTPPADSDVTYTVPADDELFWSTVDSAGDDIRICTSDGKTAVTWQFNPAFNSTTRVCTIEMDNAAPISSLPGKTLWLYWGNSTVSTGAGSFSYSAAYTAYSLVGNHAAKADRRFKWEPDRPGATKATPRIVKQAAEVLVIALDYRDMLVTRPIAYGGGLELEEPSTFDYDVYAGASAQASMVDKTAIRADERHVYLVLKAGTTATDYTLRVTMTTDAGSDTGLGRTLVWSATVNVQTLTEA